MKLFVEYSKAPEQPQSSARPICHSHTMMNLGRETATIRIAAYRSSPCYSLRHGRQHWDHARIFSDHWDAVDHTAIDQWLIAKSFFKMVQVHCIRTYAGVVARSYCKLEIIFVKFWHKEHSVLYRHVIIIIMIIIYCIFSAIIIHLSMTLIQTIHHIELDTSYYLTCPKDKAI